MRFASAINIPLQSGGWYNGDAYDGKIDISGLWGDRFQRRHPRSAAVTEPNQIEPRWSRILFGGDYNPDQWPAELVDEDVRLMRTAHVSVATLPVFGWSAIQPAEETFTFGWLDRVIDKLHAGGVGLCLATPTATLPAWMA